MKIKEKVKNKHHRVKFGQMDKDFQRPLEKSVVYLMSTDGIIPIYSIPIRS